MTEPPGLLRNGGYRRLWLSLLFSALAGQVGSLTVALTAANVVGASPAQVAMLGALGTLSYVLFMLPAGVWLDRVRKLPVYVAGEMATAAALLCIPFALILGRPTMELLYAITVLFACVGIVAGTAGQVLLTQVVSRDRLVEAHAKNRVATSFAEMAGPAATGVLAWAAGVGVSAAVGCALLLASVVALRGLRVEETLAPPREGFWRQLAEGVRFVRGDPLLWPMALAVGAWQVFQTCAMATQVLFATRELGMSPAAYGLCMTAAGMGTLIAASWSHRLAKRLGPGPAMLIGMAVSGTGWLQLALAPDGAPGIGAFAVMMSGYGVGVGLIFSNMLALRQAITPPHMLARMTSTMRWLTLFPALPGTLLGGALAEYQGLRFPVATGGAGAVALALLLWRFSGLSSIRTLGR